MTILQSPTTKTIGVSRMRLQRPTTWCYHSFPGVSSSCFLLYSTPLYYCIKMTIFNDDDGLSAFAVWLQPPNNLFISASHSGITKIFQQSNNPCNHGFSLSYSSIKILAPIGATNSLLVVVSVTFVIVPLSSTTASEWRLCMVVSSSNDDDGVIADERTLSQQSQRDYSHTLIGLSQNLNRQ